ncbi:hypothetical protein FHW74_001441 [Atlantibacter sp. RC6]|nr:hypothetical protein [Atlantibacter sp. RC6]
MAWTISALQNELNNEAYCCYSVSRLQDSLSLKLKEHGDLLLNISMTSRQMLIETLICPVESIHDVNKLNIICYAFRNCYPYPRWELLSSIVESTTLLLAHYRSPHRFPMLFWKLKRWRKMRWSWLKSLRNFKAKGIARLNIRKNNEPVKKTFYFR